MARRVAAAALVIAAASTALSGQAAASVGSRLPHLGPIPIKTPHPRGFAVPKGFQATTGMTYHGGSVMHANTTNMTDRAHALFLVAVAGGQGQVQGLR